jgi:hypothetical protein
VFVSGHSADDRGYTTTGTVGFPTCKTLIRKREPNGKVGRLNNSA